MSKIVAGYGSPEEVAAAYKQIEVNTTPYKEGHIRPIPEQIAPAVPETRSVFSRFFGVVIEPRAWGALFYMLLYCSEYFILPEVTGLSLSLGLIILVSNNPGRRFAEPLQFCFAGRALVGAAGNGCRAVPFCR
jgi:hypothetical protein